MHEMSLCENILNTLEQEALRQGFSRVTSVWLEVGALAPVEIEALHFSFPLVVRATLADGAHLHIDKIPAQAHCFACDARFSPVQRYDPCPNCGSYRRAVMRGEEMRIKELEVS